MIDRFRTILDSEIERINNEFEVINWFKENRSKVELYAAMPSDGYIYEAWVKDEDDIGYKHMVCANTLPELYRKIQDRIDE